MHVSLTVKDGKRRDTDPLLRHVAVSASARAQGNARLRSDFRSRTGTMLALLTRGLASEIAALSQSPSSSRDLIRIGDGGGKYVKVTVADVDRHCALLEELVLTPIDKAAIVFKHALVQLDGVHCGRLFEGHWN